MPVANNAENNNKIQPPFRSANPAKVRSINFHTTTKSTDDRQQPGFGEKKTTQK
jgi:hypothetical protein